ncbi:MAG: class I SAM-dependent methyltransferase [Candidatus Omnitrophica bacterium]|nr:class I SAM-dependent methyltransferase [Candidatus Omnitrophota bacterium]
MCDTAGIIFGVKNFSKEEIEGKRIIEVGSFDENGSLRPFIESLNPREYIGIDIKEGPGVDMICSVEEMVEKFGRESFDIIISTELLEHVRDYKRGIANIKNICKLGGTVFITTRSYGFLYHGFPSDYWRFEASDLEYIFSDCLIEKIEKDKYSPGVFIKVRKPKDFKENDLASLELYSIILDKRTKEIKPKDINIFQKRKNRNQRVKKIINDIGKLFYRIVERF